ncbi:Malectin-like domain, partial [Dillenia turbinata]
GSVLAVLLSIDCGSSTSHKDGFEITWTGDDEYIQTGESKSVGNTGNDAAMNTLRVFTSPTKNCYNIPGEQGTKILLRASFYYGNYDSKSTPPTFDLLFDGNFWDTINTTPDTVIYREVTYIPKSKNISLCLGQKYTNQFPIISTIEVRSLGSNIYSLKDISEYPLLLSQRTDYTWGSADKVVRSTNDEYDRIWTRFSWSAVREKGWEDLTSNTSTIDVSKASDNPPELLLSYGVQTANTSTNLVLDVSTLSSTKVAVYINMYFTEVWDPAYLNSSERRSFDIYLDNQIIAKDFSPVFAVAAEISKINVSASSASNFYLAATSNSTLPPLIMGAELFVVGTALANGTNTQDVSGLASLQQGFSALLEWSGDPCLPAEYPWEWVKCTSNSTPRVTSLLLGSYKLSGKLPDFSSLDAIQSM